MSMHCRMPLISLRRWDLINLHWSVVHVTNQINHLLRPIHWIASGLNCMSRVFPRCKSPQIPPYLSVDGHFFPCCWIANEPYIKDVKSFLGDSFDTMDVKQHSIAEIKTGAGWNKLEASWDQGLCWPCTRFCSQDYTKLDGLQRNKKFTIMLKLDYTNDMLDNTREGN